MKKRFSALFLALALCLGLAVPAFAADEGPSLTFEAPDNSGIIYEAQATDVGAIGFARSGSNNAHIVYGTYEDWTGGVVSLVPKGVDIVVAGVKSTADVELNALSPVDLEGDTHLFYRLFVWEDGKDISFAPLNVDDPMKFEYDDPMDGKNHAAGHITAAEAGFHANEDGDVVLDSERLYALFGEGNVLRIIIGESFWLFQLSGEPKLISSVFTDVPVGNWVTDPVAWAVRNNITNGAEKDKFSPGKDCTQAQILTFLYRAARGEGEAAAEDVEKAINWAREKGIIDDTFDSNKPCTRATAVNYIWQAFDKPSAQASSFTDVPADASYGHAVDWAVEKGVTKGASDTAFSPDKVCSRGEIATFLYRAYN